MTVNEVLEQAQQLNPEEQKELIKLLVDVVTSDQQPKKQRSLLELAGLGAEIWEGIDPQAYINQLRSEWDDRP